MTNPPNDIIVDRDVILVSLHNGQYAHVDASDWPDLSMFSWRIQPNKHTFYATAADGFGGRHWMHRYLLKAERPWVVDHINGNGLDNRRSNLRLCTQSQNLRNMRRFEESASGFRGVIARKGRFEAYATYDGRQHSFGLFDTALEAAFAYDREAKRLFGDFARPNFSEDFMTFKLTADLVDELRRSVKWRINDGSVRPEPHIILSPSQDRMILWTDGRPQCAHEDGSVLLYLLKAERAEPGFTARMLSTEFDPETMSLEPVERAKRMAAAREARAIDRQRQLDAIEEERARRARLRNVPAESVADINLDTLL